MKLMPIKMSIYKKLRKNKFKWTPSLQKEQLKFEQYLLRKKK